MGFAVCGSATVCTAAGKRVRGGRRDLADTSPSSISENPSNVLLNKRLPKSRKTDGEGRITFHSSFPETLGICTWNKSELLLLTSPGLSRPLPHGPSARHWLLGHYPDCVHLCAVPPQERPPGDRASQGLITVSKPEAGLAPGKL